MLCFVLIVAPPSRLRAEVGIRFVNEAPARGILPYVMESGSGGGLAAADFDGDGDIDVFVPNAEGHPDQLYQNQGNGTFRDVANDVGLASTAGARCALWFDYDGDHDLDLLVVNDDETRSSTFTLYANDQGRFEDATSAAALNIPLPPRIDSDTVPYRGGLGASDLNGDGYLDLFVSTWNGKSQLLFNNGDGTFRNATGTAGINTALHYGHQPAFLDFNGDGLQDIYLAVDFLWNALYMNNGDETFSDHAAEAGLDNAMNDMGMTLGDVDADGDFDIYITNIFQPFQYNVLFRNDSAPGRMSFTEIARQSGTDYGGWGWGTTFLDADNDGRPDIAATNGWSGSPHDNDKSVFYHNRSGRTPQFDNLSGATGYNDSEWGSGLVALDIDRDGDADLMQTCNQGPLLLLVNHRQRLSRERHFVTVKPRMDGPNHFAIGAIVRIESENTRGMRQIHAGTSFLSQEPAEAHFGLGPDTMVERLVVEWPDGTVTDKRRVTGDQVVVIRHGGQGDFNADGRIDGNDYRNWQACHQTRDCDGRCRAADINRDCAIDLRDFATFQIRYKP